MWKNQNNCFWVVRKYEFNSLKIYAFYFHALLLIVLFSKKKKAVIVLSLCTCRSLSSNLNLELVIYFLIILDNYIGNWQAMSYFSWLYNQVWQEGNTLYKPILLPRLCYCVLALVIHVQRCSVGSKLTQHNLAIKWWQNMLSTFCNQCFHVNNTIYSRMI